MIFSDFMYIIKKVLVSPFVIGIVITAFLYLKLVFYILNYSKKRKVVKLKKVSKNKKEVGIEATGSPEDTNVG